VIAVYIITVTILMILAIIVLGTEHQRKMAQIALQNRGPVESDRLQALEQQISELTTLVHQQTIALDTLAGRPLPQADRIENRIGSGI